MQKPLNPYAQTIKKEQDDIVLAYMPALRAMAVRLRSVCLLISTLAT